MEAPFEGVALRFVGALEGGCDVEGELEPRQPVTRV